MNQYFVAPTGQKTLDSVTIMETDKTVKFTCAVPAASQFVHPIFTCRVQGIRALLEYTAIQAHSTTPPNLNRLMTKHSYNFSRNL